MPTTQKSLPQWIQHLQDRSLSPATIERHQGWLTRLAKFVQKPYAEMTVDDLAAFIGTLDDKSKRTRNIARQTIKQFFRKFLNWTTDQLNHPKLETERLIQTDPKIPTREQIEQMIDAAGMGHNGVRNRALIAMLAYGGMRIGAVSEFPTGSFKKGLPAYMRFGDIEREEHCITVHIRKSKIRRERHVYITNDTAMARIIQWLDQHPTKKEDDPFFCTLRKGRYDPLSYNSVYLIVMKAAKHIGIAAKDFRPHLLRYASASSMAEEDIDSRFIEQQHGWVLNSPQAARYIHMSPESVKQEILRKRGIIPEEKPIKREKPRLRCAVCDYRLPTNASFCPRCATPTSEKGSREARERIMREQAFNLRLDELEQLQQKFKKQLGEIAKDKERIIRMRQGEYHKQILQAIYDCWTEQLTQHKQSIKISLKDIGTRHEFNTMGDSRDWIIEDYVSILMDLKIDFQHNILAWNDKALKHLQRLWKQYGLT